MSVFWWAFAALILAVIVSGVAQRVRRRPSARKRYDQRRLP